MNLPELSFGQYQLVYNAVSLTLAVMAASAVFFILARSYVAPRYQIALYISATVVFIAAYHYFRIFNSWSEAYTLSNGVYKPTGIAFNDAYRYADWLATVPLLLTELVLVRDTIKGCGNTLRAVYPSSWQKSEGLKPEGCFAERTPCGGTPPWGSVPKWLLRR